MVDQAIGGALMKVVSIFGYGIPFAVIFFRWYNSEKPGKAAPTPMPAQPDHG